MYREISFEELPLFREGDFISARADVTATILVTGRGKDWDWSIKTLSITADNGKFGAEAESKSITLVNSDPRWAAIVSEIYDHHHQYVEDEISETLAWAAE